MKRLVYFSDLHVFCRRSRIDEYMPSILDAIDQSDVVVLNGDIFDFHWTSMGSQEETAKAAVGWLEKLAAPRRKTQFHYVLGNHDWCRPFLNLLDSWAQRIPNLEVHKTFLRLGSSVFLHGEPAVFRMNQDRLDRLREGWIDLPRRGRIRGLAYEGLYRAHLMQTIHKAVFPFRRVCRLLLAYLNSVDQGPSTGLREVYFGHTHLPVSGEVFQGIRFYNSGAPLRQMEFQLIEGEIDP